MFGTATPVKAGHVDRVIADGAVVYADDKSVALFLTFDQIDALKATADGERTAQVREGRRQPVSIS